MSARSGQATVAVPLKGEAVAAVAQPPVARQGAASEEKETRMGPAVGDERLVAHASSSSVAAVVARSRRGWSGRVAGERHFQIHTARTAAVVHVTAAGKKLAAEGRRAPHRQLLEWLVAAGQRKLAARQRLEVRRSAVGAVGEAAARRLTVRACRSHESFLRLRRGGGLRHRSSSDRGVASILEGPKQAVGPPPSCRQPRASRAGCLLVSWPQEVRRRAAAVAERGRAPVRLWGTW